MFWIVFIVQALAIEPYFGPRGFLWLGINPKDENYNTTLPTFLVDPHNGKPYYSQNGFHGTLQWDNSWSIPDCNTCSYTIMEDKLYSTTDVNGNLYRYSYDEQGNLTHIQLPTSAMMIISYDQMNRVESIQFGTTKQNYQYHNSENISKVLVYSAGRLQYTISEEISTQKTASSQQGTTDEIKAPSPQIRRVIVENPLGHRMQSFFDPKGQLIKLINPLGHPYLFDHQKQDSNHTIKTTLPSGKTFFTNIQKGHMSSIEYPNGQKRSFSYDAFGNITEWESEYGDIQKFSYYKKKMSSIEGKHRNIYIQQTETGEVFTDSLGMILRVEKDDQGRIVKLVDPVGGNVSFTYGTNSMRISNRNGVSIDIQYNSLRQISSIEGEDFQFNLSRMQNGLLKKFDFLDKSYLLQWNSQDQLIQIVMPDGTKTNFVRNLAGDLTSIQYGSGQEIYQYNSNGNLISFKNAEGQNTFSYDVDGKITATNEWKLQYSLNNRLQSIEQNNGSLSYHFHRGYLYEYGIDGSKITIERDIYHYPSKVIDGSNEYIYSYNPRGFLISEQRKIDQRTLYMINYEYNLCYWPIQYKYGEKVWNMTYDSSGYQLTKELPNTSKIGYIRDSWGRIQTLRYPSGRMLEILRSNGQIIEIHKGIDSTSFLETTYTFSASDIWNSFDMGDGNYFVRRNNMNEIISIDNGDVLLYARGGPSTYDSKMGMVITDETGRHVGLQTFTGVELWDLPSGYFTYTWKNDRLKEMYSGTEVGKLFYNDLHYLDSYCRDWRCWKFTYTPYGDLLDIHYLDKPYDTLIRANNEILFRSGLDLLHSKLGVVVSSISDQSHEKSKLHNREIGYSLREIPLWYTENEKVQLVDTGFFGYPFNHSLSEWTLLNNPVSFPSGPILHKGNIQSPISGTLLYNKNAFIPDLMYDSIQPIIDMIAMTEDVSLHSTKGLYFSQPSIPIPVQHPSILEQFAPIPFQTNTPAIELFAHAIVQGKSDPGIEEIIFALLENDIRSMKQNIPIQWVWPWWMNEQKSHYLLAELPKIE